ncbi:MAG: LPS export ABC transporter periplasmic protein LptC [Elusimicrobium sp.]|jgi:LPS export ABC transporter protein LptC|nr:LPS export ABC transporter periplasmic protein LptC [Elusimicrobium sp.]
MKKLILLTVVFLSACGGPSAPEGDEESGVQTAETAVIYEAQGGLHTWILNVKTAKFYEGDETAFLTEPQLQFRDGTKNMSSITADAGTASMKDNSIVLQGNVYGKSAARNAELKTTVLNYDIKNKKIWTDETVYVRRNGVTVRAKGLRANGDFSEIEFKGQTTTIPENEKDF